MIYINDNKIHNIVFERIRNNGIIEGDIVLSKAGHDNNRIYTVLSVENKIAFIADGDKRKVCCPKKKRVTHLKVIGSLHHREARLAELSETQAETDQNKMVQNWISEFLTEHRTHQFKEEP